MIKSIVRDGNGCITDVSIELIKSSPTGQFIQEKANLSCNT